MIINNTINQDDSSEITSDKDTTSDEYDVNSPTRLNTTLVQNFYFTSTTTARTV